MKEGKTLEEVGKEYLEELIQRNLVQVSSLTIDDKVTSCCVHDILREMILTKFKDLKFCQWISADDWPMDRGIIRRMSIATGSNDLMESVESSHVRSLLFVKGKNLQDDFVKEILSKHMTLKLLDFENSGLSSIPEDLGNLIHLKYLSLRGTHVSSLFPKSIVNLQNLETLDLRRARVRSMTKEILKLRKLQHLLSNAPLWSDLKDGIGGLASLQTLREVWFPEAQLITELKKLTKLQELRLFEVKVEHGSALGLAINKMQHLEKLYLINNEVLDLHSISFPPKLRKLVLSGRLNKLPESIPKLQNLVKLALSYSKLDEDPSKSLQHMKNLLCLSIKYQAYDGESLHFQVGGFQKLKELNLKKLINLNSIVIEEGALHSLKKLKLIGLPQLKTVPSGIQHFMKLEVLTMGFMPQKFVNSISSDGGQDYWMVRHVPQLIIGRF